MLIVDEGNGLAAIHEILVNGILGVRGDELQGGVAHGGHPGLRGLWAVDLDRMDNEKEVDVRKGVVRVTGFHGADIKGNVDDFELAREVAVDHGRGTPGSAHHSGGAPEGHFGSLQQADLAF